MSWHISQALVGVLMHTRRRGKNAEHQSRRVMSTQNLQESTRSSSCKKTQANESTRSQTRGSHTRVQGIQAGTAQVWRAAMHSAGCWHSWSQRTQTHRGSATEMTPNRIHMHKPTGKRVHLSPAVNYTYQQNITLNANSKLQNNTFKTILLI